MTSIEKSHRVFVAHESSHAARLNGRPLATSWQRIIGFFADLLLAIFLWFPIEWAWHRYAMHEKDIHLTWDFHEIGNIPIATLPFSRW
jgi:hypothetical protein